jgi:alpha-tubulin suppressor-like RCC1 family protein
MKTVRVVRWLSLAMAFAACGSGDKKLELGGSCSLNSDCAGGLICKFGACHKACMKSVDCATGERCVQVDNVAVCQLVTESACGVNFACLAPLACRQTDNTCRNMCTTTDDCLGGQTCSGTFCIETKESAPVLGFDGGGADGAATPDAGVAAPDLPAAAADVPMADAPIATPDAPIVSPETEAVDAPVSGKDAAIVPLDTAKPDTTPSTVCTPACTVGQECVSGTCQPCGRSAGQPCCAGVCNANLTCNPATNQCACGDQDQACCGGNTCSTALACESGTCKCGGFGSACCPGNTCAAGGVCAGLRCGCVQSCENGFYWKTDGTFHGPFSLTNADGSTRDKATSLAVGAGSGAACVVSDDGTVWCQGSNSNGQLGNGDASMASSAKLVRALSAPAPSGSSLAGIKKVASGDQYTCALASDGSVWCWGLGTSGQLGTGNSLSSSYAIPVLDSPAGSRLTGATDLAVAHTHACVLKQDGSVWCWGTNRLGQLGIGSTSASASPAKVVGLLNPAVFLSVGNYYYGMEYAETCIIDSQKSVWCWGFMAGPDGAGDANVNKLPVRLVMTTNGAALTDAVEVDAENRNVLKSDGSLWYVGKTNSTPPVTENSMPVSGVFWLGRGCWIGSDGALRGITNPTCP